MGADGNIVIARRDDFAQANPTVEPRDLRLYTGTVLGVEAYWGYYGDNLWEPNYGLGDDPSRGWDSERSDFVALTPEQQQARKDALAWFEANAEVHEVWT